MAVANCKRCGQMFHRTNRAICPDCVAEEDEAFQIVRAYLKQHREANMQQLVDETGVDEEFIIDMLHEVVCFWGTTQTSHMNVNGAEDLLRRGVTVHLVQRN